MKTTSFPSMRKMADRAGVSHMTVSLALRNDPQLPAETRQRIQQIARQMGYRPNPLVHAFMAQVRIAKPMKGSITVGYLTAFPTRDGSQKASHIFREYFDGVAARAAQLGYQLEELWAKEPGMTGRRLTQVLRARNIRGLIIGPVKSAHGHLSLDWSHFAAATMGFSLTRPDLHRAAANHYQGMRLALRTLKRIGYRRIGYVTSRQSESRVNESNLAALLVHQYSQRPDGRIPTLFMNSNWDQKQFRTWLLKYRPDAIVAQGGMIADDVRRGGLRVPEDVATVALMWSADRAVCAGVKQDAMAIGSATLDLVHGQLQRNEYGIPSSPKLVLINSTWVDGPSVRSRSA